MPRRLARLACTRPRHLASTLVGEILSCEKLFGFTDFSSILGGEYLLYLYNAFYEGVYIALQRVDVERGAGQRGHI